MKTIHDHDFLTLGFGSKGIGICVVDVSEARSFVVPVLESCDENFTLLPLEITMKETMIKEIMLKVMSLKGNLLKLTPPLFVQFTLCSPLAVVEKSHFPSPVAASCHHRVGFFQCLRKWRPVLMSFKT
ncbi:hypothetical protein LWI29_001723 [Acer saccharum]|uniref:Uncharacterized protein n=1 Tax=Acer saccharum TaxID=4024 RepID=A0AA39SN35_ACESA|nr:hypothetical protein LWI29_001723 [Acer saccharum]